MSGVTLYKHQEDAIKQFTKKNNMLLWLPPGSGKSYILFSVIKYPALVVTHKYVIYEQIYQLKKFNPEISTYHISSGKDDPPKGVNIYFITPQLVGKQTENILKLGISFLAIDESHMYKNALSKQSKYAMKLSKTLGDIPKICMSGTPAPESILDLYPQMQVVTGGIFPDWWSFVGLFAKKKKMLWGENKIYVPKPQKKLIYKMFAPFIFTRKKEELPLPEQSIRHIPLKMPEKLREAYEMYQDEFYIQLEMEGTFLSVFAPNSPYQTMREICSGFITDNTLQDKKKIELCRYKMNVALDIASNDDSQIIIWGNLRKELEMMYDVAGKDSRLIYGGISNGSEIIKDFKKGKFKILIANPMCVGAGVSLENCHRMCYLTTPVKASDAVQSLSRTNRVTQKHQEEVFFLFYENSIEELITKKTDKKIWSQEDILKAIIEERRVAKVSKYIKD